MRTLACLLLAACGSSNTDPLVPDGGNGKPECAPCHDTLVRETDPCGQMLDDCTNDMTLSADQQVACFQADGRCYSEALDRASDCHIACGDPDQAQVESCTGVCFTDHADCAERAIRRADGCFDSCGNDPLECELCKQLGVSDLNQCTDDLSACAEACKR